MTSAIHLPHTPAIQSTTIPLVSSKSESNRALIIQALAKNTIELENLAEARDTQTMIRLLESNDTTLDVLDAGTTMRFLTAYCTVMNKAVTLTGTARMQQRPIGILVDALRALGGHISYSKNEGYPPVQIRGFEQQAEDIQIQGNVSSQYISALLMIAPVLPKGLRLTLAGKVGSKPYIEMTLSLMQRFGVQHHWEGKEIIIEPQTYLAGKYAIESDWSGASYWYSLLALSNHGSLFLKGLRANSLQGDSAIVEIMAQLGVSTLFKSEGAHLSKKEAQPSFEYDFTHCPDLAQTIAVLCATKGIHAKLKGLESLRIKEADRIAAIKQELTKIGANVSVVGDEMIEIQPSELNFAEVPFFETYDDHRMAMAFAPLCTQLGIIIEDPLVVNKSYPSFWNHLALVGIEGILQEKA